MMEFLSTFIQQLIYNEDFRLGFFWGIGWMVALGFLVGPVSSAVEFQTSRVRQFFEPTKKPAKPAVETGPSPASMMFGCLAPIFVMIFFIVGMVFLWQWYSPGR